MRRRSIDRDRSENTMSRIHVKFNDAQIDDFLFSPTGPVVQEVARVARRVENQAKRNAPVDEGTLRASIFTEIDIARPRVTARVGSKLKYALYVHEGTGIYGPRGAVIRPRTASVLVFEPGRLIGPLPRGRRESPRGRRGGPIFAKFVRGIPKNPFLVEALIAESPWPVHLLM